MSHTVTLDVKLKNHEALAKAIASLSGFQNLGEGSHRLFDSTRQGLGIMLPGWSYPIVVSKEGEVFYDNYGGRWGSMETLNSLKDSYAIAVVEAKCDELGWYHERNNDELIVHHPAGGTITVQKGGMLDAAGFSGTSCSNATLPLEQAMGQRLGETVKDQMNEVQLNQNIREV